MKNSSRVTDFSLSIQPIRSETPPWLQERHATAISCMSCPTSVHPAVKGHDTNAELRWGASPTGKVSLILVEGTEYTWQARTCSRLIITERLALASHWVNAYLLPFWGERKIKNKTSCTIAACGKLWEGRRDEKSGRREREEKTRLPDLSQLLYFQGNRGARDRNWKWGVMEGPCTSDWGKRGEMKGSDHDL